MSACEKCWGDAHRGSQFSIAEEYERLIAARAAAPCTPEEQAGPDATVCPACGKRTAHQHTGQCMDVACNHWARGR